MIVLVQKLWIRWRRSADAVKACLIVMYKGVWKRWVTCLLLELLWKRRRRIKILKETMILKDQRLMKTTRKVWRPRAPCLQSWVPSGQVAHHFLPGWEARGGEKVKYIVIYTCITGRETWQRLITPMYFNEISCRRSLISRFSPSSDITLYSTFCLPFLLVKPQVTIVFEEQ